MTQLVNYNLERLAQYLKSCMAVDGTTRQHFTVVVLFLLFHSQSFNLI